MRILIATDVFPPGCGGAGWSAYYLARALRDRGHAVAVVRPRLAEDAERAGVRRTEYDGLPVAEAVVPTGRGRLGKLLARNWVAPRLLRRLVRSEASRTNAELIHAQHALTVPASVWASAHIGRRVPVVATVRDYWPVSFYGTMEASAFSFQLSAFSFRWLVGMLLLPVRRIVVARRRGALRRADAVIAVSRFVAGILAGAGAVRPGRLSVLPNLVDLPRVDEILAEPPPLGALGLDTGQAFLLFVGKLEPSKGAQLLPEALRAAGVSREMPLVVAGSGPMRSLLERQACETGLDFRFADWLDNADVLRLMRASRLLLFPSAWEEPLSRVLLEGCAAGATILALDTGGTGDIIVDGRNGRLVDDMHAFAAALRELLASPAERARLATGARVTTEAEFRSDLVVEQVEALYRRLI